MIRMTVADAEEHARAQYGAAVKLYEDAIALGDVPGAEGYRQEIKKCRLELDSLQELRTQPPDPTVAQKGVASKSRRPDNAAGVGRR
jgi:hypothetical protein